MNNFDFQWDWKREVNRVDQGLAKLLIILESSADKDSDKNVRNMAG